MSNQALKAALGRPFDPTPPTSELAGFHAPYAELTGDDVEGELRRELAGYGRVGITGVSGSGKSSLARYAADLDERFAPIYINVAGVTRTTRAEFGGSDPGAIVELATLHSSEHQHDLRRTLTTVRSAIALAADDPAELVERRHVQAADAS